MATLAERLGARLVPDPVSGCVVWTGARYVSGHGSIRIDGRSVRVHRIAWELSRGQIPDGLCVCHRCDNPPCANVDHLFLGTHADNMADMARKGRATKGPKLPELRGLNRGTNNGQARLTEEGARLGRKLRSEGLTYREIAEQLGVCQVAVFKLIKRITWRHV